MRKIAALLIVEFMVISGFGVTATIHNDSQDCLPSQTSSTGTEYWALIIGCNIFRYNPGAALPFNDVAALELRDTLLVSGHWEEDHIKLLTGKDATKKNIIDGLKWLDEMDDDDDICLFYISSHGSTLFDKYPKDENDYMDEVIMTYDTYKDLPFIGLWGFWWRYIRDDEINKLFYKLDSKGLLAIFETCFSGGFNDPPSKSLTVKHDDTYNERYFSEKWMKEIGKELSGPGRVILMACEENQISQGLCFTYYVIEGMQGKCDVNNDSICTGEEVFTYASLMTTSFLKEYNDWEQHPQIYDDYPGELPITNTNLPPLPPDDPIGPNIGKTNTELQYLLHTSDPENDNIRYHINWDDGSECVTEFIRPDEPLLISHIWAEEGTYNIWLESEDEHGAMIYKFGIPNHFTIIIYEQNQVDQYQTKIYQPMGFYDCFIYSDDSRNYIQAQSFKTTCDVLTTVDLRVGVLWGSVKSPTIKVSLRDDLYGDDLTSVSKIIPFYDLSTHKDAEWTTFDFPDLNVIPGKTYYIICSQENGDGTSGGYWLYGDPDYFEYPNSDEDPYTGGQAFKSYDGGLTWVLHEEYADDFCFVTFGKTST